MIIKKVGNLDIALSNSVPVVITNEKLKARIAAEKKVYSLKIKKANKTFSVKIKNAKTAAEKKKIATAQKKQVNSLKQKQKNAIAKAKNERKKSIAKKKAYEFNQWLSEREAYEIWITYDAEKEKIQLPVNPEIFEVKNGSKNQSVDIIGLGEITIIQDRPALRFSFKSFFPSTEFQGIKVDKLENPMDLAETINRWKASNSPIHFIIPALAINLYCSIENFDYNESGGDVGTLQYSMSLKEYQIVKMRNAKVKGNKIVVNRGKSRSNNKVKPKTYKVKSGDTLFKVAKKIYGNGSKSTQIYNANKKIIPNKNKLKTGIVLKIP